MRILPGRLPGFLIFLATACCLHAQSTLIPLTTRRDMVFDRASHYLYITTSDGWVRRYNISAGQIDGGYNVGGSLNGLDIAADDSFLLIAQDVVSGGQGTFHKLDLSTGSIVNIPYDRSNFEAGAWDVAISSNGTALATTRVLDFYSGSTPLRQINLATNSITARTDTPTPAGLPEVTSETQIHRSADRTQLYLMEPDTSGGPAFTYSAASNSFGPLVQAEMYFSTAAGAVNRNGTLVSTLVGIQYPFYLSKPKVAVDSVPNFSFIRGFAEPDSGIAFDAIADVLYAVSSSAAQIIAYDTNTFAEKFRLNIGEAVEKMVAQFGAGSLVASQDGRYLALATASGVRLFSVAAGTPSPPPAPSFTTRRDLIFDHSGQYLYLATDNGLVERFHLGNRTLEIVADLGGVLNGIDIAPDDSFLLVAQGTYGVAQGMWQKVNLVAGGVTKINYIRDFEEAGAWDVAIGSNGLALLTTSVPPGFSGFTALRQIDLATNSVTIRTDIPGQGMAKLSAGTHLFRSGDYSRLLLLEPNNSSGPVFSYSAVSNTFGPLAHSYSFLDSASAGVNRDGSLIATRRGPTDEASVDTLPGLDFVQPLQIDGGVAFNAINGTLYGVDRSKSEIVAIDPQTGIELYRFAVGEDVSIPVPVPGGIGAYTAEIGYIKLVASNDGRYLALETPQGFRIYDLPNIPSTPSTPQPIFGAIKGLVFDHSGTYLYVTTATGFVWPYNLTTGKLETPYRLGGSLAGIDIAPDDSCLVVAQQAMGLRQGRFEKISLADGAVTRINYTPQFGAEDVGWDVGIAGNGFGFGTTAGQLLYQIDLLNNVASARQDFTGFFGTGQIPERTKIRRNADATKMAFLDEYGSILFYTSSTNSFGPDSQLTNPGDQSLALNRDASLLAVRSDKTNLVTVSNLSTVHTFTDFDHAIVFDATKDILYGVNTTTDEIVGYDSATFAEQTRFAIGEDVIQYSIPREFISGAFVSGPNGRYLALQCDSALRLFDLSTKTTTAIQILPRIGNISTRAFVGTDDNVPIAGFVISGPDAKKVVLRALGPSLTSAGVPGAVEDPTLELHDSTGAIIAFNDNWKDSQENEIHLSGLAPGNELESVIVKTLSPGTYTAVMRGSHNGTGIGVVEVYDLEPNTNSKLGNISTRGFGGTGDQVMIAGVIVRSVGYDVLTPARKVLLRGLGPSLAQFGVPNALSDPVLELHNSNGAAIGTNDDWKIPQQALISSTGLAPSNDRESAMVLDLEPGTYTAILRGKNGTTGAALIEIFSLQ